MAPVTDDSVRFDPYDPAFWDDPYPVYQRLRDEAPLYYNAEHDVWALSRYADVEKGLVDWRTFSSSRGDILEIIKAGIEFPPGLVIFEDPPTHPTHRGLMARVFTPKKVAALEPQIRRFCAACLDPLVGGDRFDFVKDLGNEMPMRVIGMLLGIPESDQEAIRQASDDMLHTEEGKPMEIDASRIANGELFEEYIDWRAEHPSDDLMTDLLTAEFEDEHGVVRTLTRQEVLTYVNVVAGAGNETTGRLIGWLGKLLGEHPDQRRDVARDRSLLGPAVEEALRYEPTGLHVARYVMRDTEWYGTTVPAGSAMLLMMGSANRDERRYANPDKFDIHRKDGGHITFGFGIHFCLGAALARMEGRIALDEILDRFPDWEIDYPNIKRASTSTVRGWETLPTLVG